MLLFDSICGGSGKKFNHEKFHYECDIPFFLAGGLNAANVNHVITTVKPYGVDVSSGVEKQPGMKDKQLIQKFIDTIHAGAAHDK